MTTIERDKREIEKERERERESERETERECFGKSPEGNISHHVG